MSWEYLGKIKHQVAVSFSQVSDEKPVGLEPGAVSRWM